MADSKLKKVYNICALGNTGVGKSSFLNMLAGIRDAFLVGESSIASQTQLAESKLFKFDNKDDQIELRLIDTQGLSDTSGDLTDIVHIKNMVEVIRNLEYIDLFVICLDGQNPRFTPYIKETITLFRNIFPQFLDHSVIVFNKWNNANLDQFRNEYQSQYQELFRSEFQLERPIPCYFIDSYYNLKIPRENPIDGTISEIYLHTNIQERTRAQVIGLINYLINKNTVCDVREIKPEETERAKEKTLVNEKIQENIELNKRLEEERKLHEHQLEIARARNNRNNGFSISLNFGGSNGFGFRLGR
jgi:predicted GTPase